MSIAISGSTITFADLTTQTTALVSAAGFRNRIINGDMRIWQRGTTRSNPTTTNFYTADRWGSNRAGDVTGVVVSRIASGLAGFEYALSLQRVAGDTNTLGMFLWYSNESTNTYDLAGSPVTLSFYAKTGANYSGSSTQVILYSGTGTDQRVYNYTGIVAVASGNPLFTSTWTRYTFTGTVPANSTELGMQFSWGPTGTAGADDSVYITGVQLEAGSTATDFERRPIGVELALCQRYFVRTNQGLGLAAGTANAYNGTIGFPVTMRTTCTLEAGSTFSVGSGSVGIVASQNSAYGPNSKDSITLYNSSNNWSTNTSVAVDAFIGAEL